MTVFYAILDRTAHLSYLSTRETMILLKSHLLFPDEADYTPSLEQLLSLFHYLMDKGVFSARNAARLRIPTDEDIYARNPNTGEKICIGKRLQDIPVSVLAEIDEHIRGSLHYVVSIDNSAPAEILPFDLREKDGSKVDPTKHCRLHLTCALRDRRTQLSESWHEHFRTFLLPKQKATNACERCGAIHTPEEEVQPRFWIEFSFDGVFLPGFKDSSEEPMSPNVLLKVEAIFNTQFFHGRFFD
jgi:hypothetical protein